MTNSSPHCLLQYRGKIFSALLSLLTAFVALAVLLPTAVSAETDRPVHRDVKMQNEHDLMLDLVKLSDVSTTAQKTGAWSDPSVWSNGVPGAGDRVHIPQNISILYDAHSNAAVKTIRVDGRLSFRTDADTRLVVDTLVGNSGSSRGEDARALQRFLNSHGFTVATNGPGSPGQETDFFGNLTQQAVQAFQAANGVVSSGTPQTTGFGRVGPLTRSRIIVGL